MKKNSLTLSLPEWIDDFLKQYQFPLISNEERMRFVLKLTLQNIEKITGGPFGAAVFERESGQLFTLDIFLWTDFETCTVNDNIKKTVDYSKLVQILKDQSKKIYCYTIEKYSNAILEIIDQEFKISKIKIILTKCNPPITGFDGKVSIVRILENN